MLAGRGFGSSRFFKCGELDMSMSPMMQALMERQSHVVLPPDEAKKFKPGQKAKVTVEGTIRHVLLDKGGAVVCVDAPEVRGDSPEMGMAALAEDED